MTFKYPTPPADGGVTEEIHGVAIRDPYRALEDDHSEVTLAYMKAQNELSIPYLESHSRRAEMQEAISASYDYDKMTCPDRQADGWYYWQYNDGTFPHDIVLRSRNFARDYGIPPSPHGPELVFDPSREEHTSLYWHSWSPSGRFYNAILQKSGSDWQEIRTLDTHTMEPVNEDLTQSKFTFGGCWVGERGFLYKKQIESTDSAADGQYGVYFHKLHTPQDADTLVWSGEGPNAASLFLNHPLLVSGDATPGSGRRGWIVGDIYRNTDQEAENFMIELPGDLSLPKLGEELARLIKEEKKWLCKGYSGTMRYIGTLESDKHLFMSTYNGSSTGDIVSLDAEDWDSTVTGEDLPTSVLIPVHPEGLTLSSANLVNGRVLVLVYLRDASADVVYVDAITGHTLPSPSQDMPPNTSVTTVTSSTDSDEFFLTIESFTAPPTTLCGKISGRPSPDITISRLGPAAPVEEDLITHQIMYASHDGTRIPMFLCHAKDLDRSKPYPVLLHAYGGFQVANVPRYSPFWPAFIRQIGGIVAIACIRGGGEYGKEWHEAAKGSKRAVAWDDFATAARYLHSEGLTTPAMTSLYGTSNGGLLVAACVNRNPELFGPVLCDVGVLDLLRFHRFTMGRLWVSEYGNPDSADDMPILAATSPVHNVRPDVIYPAILVTTADHDTRVIPGHSLKYLAALQTVKSSNPNILLGRVYENTGHAAEAKSKAQMVDEIVDRLVFILKNVALE